jgi:hypothetical protein
MLLWLLNHCQMSGASNAHMLGTSDPAMKRFCTVWRNLIKFARQY